MAVLREVRRSGGPPSATEELRVALEAFWGYGRGCCNVLNAVVHTQCAKVGGAAPVVRASDLGYSPRPRADIG
jgi:hypothetical protein